MSFHEVLSSLQEIGGLIVKRGTAMGPLVLPLLLSPVLLFFAWLFDSTLVIKGIPLITVVCVIVALWLIVNYTRHYGRFAKNDPDRLQSEEYRVEIAWQKIVSAKKLPNPMTADELPIPDLAPNLPEPEASVQEESLDPNDIDEE